MGDTQGMDIGQQREMWRNFTRIVQLGVGVTVVVLALMALLLT